MAVSTTDNGFFGYQKVMDDFYGYKPGEDDDEGRAIKRNFQANMVQSGFDAALSESMAQTQSGIAQQNMTHAADLEQRNTASNMQQEFNYGMQSMGAQFEMQDKFADNQSERDLGMLTATGEQQRLTQNSKGLQDRYTAIEQGNQNRQLANVQGGYQVKQQEIAADASKYGANQSAEASKYGAAQAAGAQKYSAAASADASKYGADKSADAQKFSASQAADASKYGADKSSQASMYGADKGLEGTKYSADATIRNTTETGKQQRESMEKQDNLDAGKANRQQARSRSLARAF